MQHSGTYQRQGVRTPTVYLPAVRASIAPLGSERLIPIRYVDEGEVTVRGGATGHEYRFAAGEAREVPLADARQFVAAGNFVFSGGR